MIQLSHFFKSWVKDEDGIAATEAALVLPILIMLLMAVYDLGNAIVINHKTSNAAQIIGDLVTRNQELELSDVQDIALAGALALTPYETLTFDYDIMSVEFLEDGEPDLLWRVNSIDDANNGTLLESTRGLGSEGEGVVVVMTNYNFRPFFAGFVVDQINMVERAYLKGRRSALVRCNDCPTE